MIEWPLIDTSLCDGCSLCVMVCCCKALAMAGNVVTVVERTECTYCAECEAVCSTGAISCPYEIVVAEYHQRGESGSG